MLEHCVVLGETVTSVFREEESAVGFPGYVGRYVGKERVVFLVSLCWATTYH